MLVKPAFSAAHWAKGNILPGSDAFYELRWHLAASRSLGGKVQVESGLLRKLKVVKSGDLALRPGSYV